MAVGVGQFCLHDQAVSVLHQRMPHEAQHRRRAGRLLVKAGIRVCHGHVGRVRALLAPEVHFDVAGLANRVVHRRGLGLLALVGVCGELVGWWWWPAGIIVMRQRRVMFWLEALHGRPRLDQCAIDRKVIVRKQRLDLWMRQDRGHQLARHIRCQQTVPVLGEHRRDPHGVIDAKSDEPPEQQVIVHLLHQLPLGPDREQDLNKARPDQAFRRDGRAAEVGVARVKFGIEACQRVVHDPAD